MFSKITSEINIITSGLKVQKCTIIQYFIFPQQELNLYLLSVLKTIKQSLLFKKSSYFVMDCIFYFGNYFAISVRKDCV